MPIICATSSRATLFFLSSHRAHALSLLLPPPRSALSLFFLFVTLFLCAFSSSSIFTSVFVLRRESVIHSSSLVIECVSSSFSSLAMYGALCLYLSSISISFCECVFFSVLFIVARVPLSFDGWFQLIHTYTYIYRIEYECAKEMKKICQHFCEAKSNLICVNSVFARAAIVK